MNICILGNGFINWGGGLDFLRNQVNGLINQDVIEKVDLFVLVYQEDNIWYRIKKFIKKSILKKEPNQWYTKEKTILDFFENCDKKIEVVYLESNKIKLIDYLKARNVDIVIPAIESLGKNFPIPWIGYIYDFQHKYYPEFFTKKEIKSRNRNFEKILYHANKVIVNSKDTENDITRFYPQTKSVVSVLPFAPQLIMKWLDDEENQQEILKKYSINKDYYIICNQFWIHKNHSVAFEAIKLMKERGKEITLVCTGMTEDFRFPKYFASLQDFIKSNNLDKNVMILGLIPKLDQIQILRNARALIQPTLFEGGPGGGATYDAIALGVPVILSDIEINKEVKGENVSYFEKSNPNSLCQEIEKFEQNKERVFFNSNELIEFGNKRKRELGNMLIRTIREEI